MLRGWRCDWARSAGAGSIEYLLQFLPIQLRGLRCGDAVLIRHDVGVRMGDRLLRVWRELQVRKLIVIAPGVKQHDGSMRKIFFKFWRVDDDKNQYDVGSQRYPEGFPLASPGKLVAGLDQQGGKILHLAIRRLPGICIVKISVIGGTIGGRRL